MAHVVSRLTVSPLAARFSTQPVQRARASVSTSTDASSSTASDFLSLFKGQTYPATPATPQVTAPTAQSVFGANPWMTNPTALGPDGKQIAYNPIYFATPDTAAKVAQMVGGTVVQSYQFTPTGGAFAQQQANQMVRLSDGRMINPGVVASFYTHGYSQSYIDGLVAGAIRDAC
jgi:hypothetical protein